MIKLDAASDVSSFCAEACLKGYDVTGADVIYKLEKDEIEIKCRADLETVIEKLYSVQELYKWNYFKDIKALHLERTKAYSCFIQAYSRFKGERYVHAKFPESGFADKAFTHVLVSHFLFMYDDFRRK